MAEKIPFVIRLNLSKAHPPRFATKDGDALKLHLLPGHTETYSQVHYKGEVPANVIGVWERGFRSPLWVMTTLPPETGLAIYRQRMKIELAFRDLKSLSGLHKLMNRSSHWMEQTLALVLLAFAIGLVTGELLCDFLLGRGLPSKPLPSPPAPNAPTPKLTTSSCAS